MQTVEALRAFFRRVVPALPELFNMAHAICGNYDLAEYVLQYTLVEAWNGELRGGMGFREALRNTLRRVALEEAPDGSGDTTEFTWNGLAQKGGGALMDQLASENPETRRAVALKYGCGLSNARIAQIMGIPAGRVRELLDRFRRRAQRRLEPQERRRTEQLLGRAVTAAFAQEDASMPPAGAVYRSFAAEAMETRKPRRIALRIVRGVLIVLCGLVFWLTAALMQPTPLEDSPQISVADQQ